MNFNHLSKQKIFSRKRRGVSEIIVSLLLMAITVIGAVMVFGIFQGSGVTENIAGLTGSTQSEQRPSLQIIGYDTRNSSTLSGITSLDNTVGTTTILCALSCTPNTDMIVLLIRNAGTEEFSVDHISINEVTHTWSGANSGQSISSFPPSAGTFKIMPSTATTISSTQTIYAGNDATLVIRLSGTLSDVLLIDTMRILVNPSSGEPAFYIIPAGGIK